jgi:hypothetical protein
MWKDLALWDALALALILLLLCPNPAHAYFDLGVGTYIVQLFFAFGAAFWFSFKNSLFKRRKKEGMVSDPVSKPDASEEKTPDVGEN